MHYKVLIGNLTPQYTYLGGQLSTTSNGDTTIVGQFLSNGTAIFVRVYSYPPLIDSFTLSSDSSLLCFLMQDVSYLNIFIISASDLSVISQIRSDSIFCSDPRCRIIYDSANSYIYFYGVNANNQANIGYTE